MGRRGRRLGATVLFAALAVAGCSTFAEIEPGEEVRRGGDERRRDRNQAPGSVLDVFDVDNVGGVSVGSGRQQVLTGASVNRHLWLASIDTLSFLPIAATDPFTGLISTDWGAVGDAPGERFRVVARVTSTTLDAQALDVNVFREVRDGQVWTPAPTAPDAATRLEDAILVRARQLRIAETEAG